MFISLKRGDIESNHDCSASYLILVDAKYCSDEFIL